MRLYLMRHATAVPRGTPGALRDAQRALTDAGREEARCVGQGLRRLKLEIGLIVTSPYVRAAQTAEEVARALGVRAPVRELDALRSEVEPRETSVALRGFAGHERLLCVGHEPHLSAWLSELVAGPGGMRCVFKKGGAACVEIEQVPPPSGSGTLRWILTPKQLALIGQK
ncbi:MAG: phosphohistidine phosphatase SixA [Candidatus Omnitrophica bacterium]|nr:phosphohistidine phosphatase SixA [Candidatus Omnitrophota bacterium]